MNESNDEFVKSLFFQYACLVDVNMINMWRDANTDIPLRHPAMGLAWLQL